MVGCGKSICEMILGVYYMGSGALDCAFEAAEAAALGHQAKLSKMQHFAQRVPVCVRELIRHEIRIDVDRKCLKMKCGVVL